MRLVYHLLDVFTERPFGGNPLAVFPDAAGLEPAWMQRVARELNLSETVFVLPPETADGTHRLRIFTPTTELPFAGHPTVGTAVLLGWLSGAAEGGMARLVFEEGVGLVPVSLRHEAGRMPFAQLSAAQAPTVDADVPPPTEIAAALGLGVEDLAGGAWTPAIASAGVPFLTVAVRSREALGRARVEAAVWSRVVDPLPVAGAYVVTLDADDGVDVRARMFGPKLGIAEDPATGAAATGLAGYLVACGRAGEGTHRWLVRQGVEMGRPSDLSVEADVSGGGVTAARVGGYAVRIATGEMEIPND